MCFFKLRGLAKQLPHRRHSNHQDKHLLSAGIMREYYQHHKQVVYSELPERREQLEEQGQRVPPEVREQQEKQV